MQLSFSSNSLVVLSMLLGASSAAPAPQESYGLGASLIDGLPPTCIAFDNKGALKTPDCYTATVATVPISCPRIECRPQSDLVCPEYIKVTTVEVPCSTDCCPHTPTHTITTKCPGCPTGCVIPTETLTVTTGCKTKTVVPPLITTAVASLVVG